MELKEERFLGNHEKCCAGAYAIDKDLSTLASSATSNGGGQLALEFEGTPFIHKIIIYYMFYTNWFDPNMWCVLNEGNFKTCVDSDTNIDVLMFNTKKIQQKSLDPILLTYGLEQTDQIYTVICNFKANRVVFHKNNGYISVYEVVVLSKLGK